MPKSTKATLARIERDMTNHPPNGPMDQPTLPGFDTRKCTQCFAPTFPHGGAVQR